MNSSLSNSSGAFCRSSACFGKRGFTLIELIVVTAIIAVLAGIAVPYYQDYVTDARMSVLKQNIQNLRKVIGDFHGDMKRGPFRVQVASGAIVHHVNYLSADASGSELVAGPVQVISGTAERRRNIRYLPSLPIMEDPHTGEYLAWQPASASTYFIEFGAADNAFDFGTEFAFVDENSNKTFDGIGTDSIIFNFFNHDQTVYIGSIGKELDFISVTLTDSRGQPF